MKMNEMTVANKTNKALVLDVDIPKYLSGFIYIYFLNNFNLFII